ncbi:MAG: protease HtpX [bacterium]
MGKRIFLFALTNAAILVLVGAILYFLNIGGLISGRGFMFYTGLMAVCLIWGMIGALISLAISRWVAKWAMGVKLISKSADDKRLRWVYETVERLTRQARIPMPEVGFYESDEVNAFATGPSKKKSLVAVSTGLLDSMGKNEVEGVLGHEIAHIANGDMVTMTLLQGVINAFVMFFARIIAWAVRLALDEDYAWIVSFLVYILMTILLSILGSLVLAWFSRKREFIADSGGAEIAGRDKMIAALRALQSSVELVDAKSSPTMNAMKISGKSRILAAFSTHPPLEKRIARLEGRERG